MVVSKKPRKIDLSTKVIAILIISLFFISFQDFIGFVPVEGEVKEDADGNLLIDAGSVHPIDMDGGTYQMQGNITVDGAGSTLIIRNTTLKFLKGTGFRYHLEVKNKGTVLIENSEITVDLDAGGSEERVDFFITNSDFIMRNSSLRLPGDFKSISSNITVNSSTIARNNFGSVKTSVVLNLTSSNVLMTDAKMFDMQFGEDIYLRGATNFSAINTYLNLTQFNNLKLFDSSIAKLYALSVAEPNSNSLISVISPSAYAQVYRLLSIEVLDVTSVPVGGAEITPKNFSNKKVVPPPAQEILDYLGKTVSDYNITNYLGEVTIPLKSDNITKSGISYTGNFELETTISTYSTTGAYSLKPYPNFHLSYNRPTHEISFTTQIPPEINKHYSKALPPLTISTTRNYNTPLQLQQNLIIDGGTLNLQSTDLEMNQSRTERFFVLLKNGGKLNLVKSRLMDPAGWPLNVYAQDFSEITVNSGTLGLGSGILSLRNGTTLKMNGSVMTGSINSIGSGNKIIIEGQTSITAENIVLINTDITLRDSQISTGTIQTEQVMLKAVNTTFNKQLTFKSGSTAYLTNVTFPGVPSPTITIKDTSEVHIFWWLTVRVVDGGSNLLEKAMVHLYNYSLSGGKLLYAESETDVSGRAIFEVYSERRNASGSFKGIERNYFMNATYRNSKSNDMGTLPLTSNKEMELEFDLAADLALIDVLVIGNLFAGNILTINATVKNLGDFDLNTTEIPIRFYINGNVHGTDEMLSRLAVDETATVSKEWTASLGTHIINVSVDPIDEIGEKNESNNRKTEILSITVAGPDLGLTASDITFDPAVPTKDTNMTISAKITNYGGYDPADNNDIVTVKFYKNDPALGGTQIGTAKTIDSIPPTTSKTVTMNYTISEEGNYNIFVIVETQFDSKLSNNKMNRTLVIYTLPDLYIAPTDITFLPSSKLIHEDTVYIRAVVHNIGGTSVDNVGVAFYDGDPSAGGVRIGFNTTIQPVAPNGGTVTAQIEWTPTVIGNHKIFVYIDPDELIIEAKNTNNIANITVNVLSKPNLYLESTDIIFSANPIMEGERLDIQVLIHNEGDVNVENVRIRVTLNSLTGDNLVPDIQILSIPANGYFNLPITWTSAEPNGTHNIYVWIDPENAIPESNKLDNHAFKSISITKTIDLRVTEDDIYLNNQSDVNRIDFGKEVYVTARVWNDGGSPTITDFIVQFFLRNSEGDRQLGTDKQVQSIDPGSYTDISVGWFANISGSHEIQVFVDPSGLVLDSNLVNNKAFKAFTVKDPPDLAVIFEGDVFSSGEFVRSGTEVTINAFVQNRGETGWGPVEVMFHDGDPQDVINGSTQIGSTRLISFLDVNEQELVNATWTAFGDGIHNIYVSVDFYEMVPDSDRRNNFDSSSLEVLTNAVDFKIVTFDFSPESPEKGDLVTINFTISNIGNLGATSVKVGLYDDNVGFGNLIDEKIISPMIIGGSISEQFKWNGTILGINYRLILIVDPDNEFKEFNKNNNKIEINITVESDETYPDLGFVEASWITVTPDKPQAGEIVVFTLNLENIGDTGISNVIVLLKEDGAELARSDTIAFLAQQAKSTVDITWEPEASGIYFLTFEIITEGGVRELNEINNEKEYTIDIDGASSDDDEVSAMFGTAIAAIVIIVILIVLVLLLMGRKRRITEWAECSECQEKMPLDAMICPSCGAEFSDEMECGECHKLISVDDTKCPHCGAAFVEDAEDKKKRGLGASEEEVEIEGEETPLAEEEAAIATTEEELLEAEVVPIPPEPEKLDEIEDKEDELAEEEKEDEEKDEEGKEEKDKLDIDEDEDFSMELDEEEFQEFEAALDEEDDLDDLDAPPLNGISAIGEAEKKKKKKKKKKNKKATDNDVKSDSGNELEKKEKDSEDKDKKEKDKVKADKKSGEETGDESKDEKDDFVIPQAKWTAECYKCNARIPLSASKCPECGAEFE